MVFWAANLFSKHRISQFQSNLVLSHLQGENAFGVDLVSLGFHFDPTGKEFPCNEGDLSSIPGLGRSLGEGKGYPLQYSGLENSTGSQSQTRLSDFHFTLLDKSRKYAGPVVPC